MDLSSEMQIGLQRMQKAAEKMQDAESAEACLRIFEDIIAETENSGLALVGALSLLILQLTLAGIGQKTPLNFRRMPLAYLRYSWLRARTPEERRQHDSLVQGLRKAIEAWCEESGDRVQTYHDLAMFVEWKIAQTGIRSRADQEALLRIPDWIVNKQLDQILGLFSRQ